MIGEIIRLRVVVHNPPKGVAFAMQLGRDELIQPKLASKSKLVFEADAQIKGSKAGDARLSGAIIQGPAGKRFVYINTGKRAGQEDTCWDRRAKVMLDTVTEALLRKCATTGAVLEAEIDGLAKDGGPCCATVPLLRGGWRAV